MLIPSLFWKLKMMINEIDFEKTGGLLPAIVQDFYSCEVLMLAYMNKEALDLTISSGKATYFSRSRQELWIKGETSGHIQYIKEIRLDCDNDAILLKVEQVGGAACHTGYRSCFFNLIKNNSAIIDGVKVFDPEEVYGI
jgi:phosphoribosyl-AMP cyclohydrolase